MKLFPKMDIVDVSRRQGSARVPAPAGAIAGLIRKTVSSNGRRLMTAAGSLELRTLRRMVEWALRVDKPPQGNGSALGLPATKSALAHLKAGFAERSRFERRGAAPGATLEKRLSGPGTGRFEKSSPETVESSDGIDFSEEALKHELELTRGTQVSPCVAEWGRLYSQVGPRSAYLWTWATRGAELTTLPCVPPEFRTHVRDTKVLSIIICVLLDDAADAQKKEGLLEILLDVMAHRPPQSLEGLSEEERRYVSVTHDLCTTYDRRVREYPYYEVYKDLLEYDLMQFLNTMRYSNLLNRHRFLLNLAEHEIYFPHNMHMMSFATLDLMCTSEFDVRELGRLREAVWHGQCMGRIGNLLSTWRRELAQGDFTSDVFARAVAEGDLSGDQLSIHNSQQIEEIIRAGGHEEFFFERWRYHRDRFRAMADLVRSVDLRKCLEGHERFFRMHLASRGLI